MLSYRLFNVNQHTRKTKELMQKFESEFNLQPFLYTSKVKIKENVIPHSHPMLTLNTFWNDSPYHLLSTFIHEQMHWYLNWSDKKVYSKVHTALRQKFPNIPKDQDLVASNVYSTYTHLVICYLEYQGLSTLIGEKAARETVLSFPHYKWIFGSVVAESSFIHDLLETNKLTKPMQTLDAV